MAARLLVLDLDGTLVRGDGTIDPRDRDALVQARRAGVGITLATGRLVAGALPTARSLEVILPMICADGAVVACSKSGEPLESRGLPCDAVEATVATFAEHALLASVFAPDTIHVDGPVTERHAVFRPWTPNLVLHPCLAMSAVWRACDVVLALGVGDRERVESAARRLERLHAGTSDVATFVLGGRDWAVRVQVAGCSKGDALARWSERLALRPEDVAVVGDWYNDLSMFAWAGRSFAMGNAPEAVRAAATDVLRADAWGGGGVAEAIDRWLR